MKTNLYPQINPPAFLVLLITLSGFSSSAFAEIDFSGLYSGMQYSSSEFKARTSTTTSTTTTTVNNGHIKAKLGYIINDNLTVEGQLGLNTNSNDKLGTVTFGTYLRASKDYGQYKPYGLVGLGGYYSYDDVADNDTQFGGSLGVGLEIFGSKDLAISVEYLRILDKTIDGSDITFDTVGLGFTYYFTEDKSYFNKNRNKVRSIRY